MQRSLPSQTLAAVQVAEPASAEAAGVEYVTVEGTSFKTLAWVAFAGIVGAVNGLFLAGRSQPGIQSGLFAGKIQSFILFHPQATTPWQPHTK